MVGKIILSAYLYFSQCLLDLNGVEIGELVTSGCSSPYYNQKNKIDQMTDLEAQQQQPAQMGQMQAVDTSQQPMM